MNNTFNTQRLGLLLKRQWLEFGKIYLISLMVLMGIFLAFYGYNYYHFVTDYKEIHAGDSSYRVFHFRIPVFVVTGLIFGTLVASTYFSHLGQKSKAVIDLLIPASTFEKFLAGIFYTLILSTLSFMTLFYLTDLFFVMKVRAIFEEATKAAIQPSNRLDYFFTENNVNDFKALYFIPCLITSPFLLGSVYFNRFHYVKTAISLMVFMGAWALIVINSGEALFRGRVIANTEQMQNINGKGQAELLVSLLIITLSLIFWGLTYLRLKEKEV